MATRVNKTFKDIEQELKKFGRSPRKYQNKQVIKKTLAVTPQVGSKRLVFKASVRGNSNPRYVVTFVFHDVKITSERVTKKQIKLPVKKTGTNKILKYVYCSVPSLKKNRLMMKSDDLDFRFKFMKELADNGSLWPNSNAWIRYDARKELKKKPGRKFYKVKHPQGGSYYRATPHPDDGGRDFMNPNGLMGYSYPIKNFKKFLLDNDYIRY